jgi:hypothetical protein
LVQCVNEDLSSTHFQYSQALRIQIPATYQLEVPGPAPVVPSSAKSVRLDSQTPVVRHLGPGYSAGPPDLSHALVSRRGTPSPYLSLSQFLPQWQDDLLVQCQRRLVFNPLSVLSGTASRIQVPPTSSRGPRSGPSGAVQCRISSARLPHAYGTAFRPRVLGRLAGPISRTGEPPRRSESHLVPVPVPPSGRKTCWSSVNEDLSSTHFQYSQALRVQVLPTRPRSPVRPQWSRPVPNQFGATPTRLWYGV